MLDYFRKYSKTIIRLVKVLLVVVAVGVIYRKIAANGSVFAIDWLSSRSQTQLFFWVLMMMLMSSINWMLEGYKWKILVASFKKISFKTAMIQSLVAHTAAFITPFKSGELAIKPLFYEKNKTKKVVYLSFLGNISQLVMTLVFGLIGLYHIQLTPFDVFTENLESANSALLISGLFVSMVVVAYWWIRKNFDFVKGISIKIHVNNYLLACIRYLVFSHQWILLVYFFSPSAAYTTTLMAVFCMYLLASVIPTFALLDWVVKGSVAIYLLGFLGIPTTVLVLISLLMWIFNFAIPALIGSYFIVRFNIKNSLMYA